MTFLLIVVFTNLLVALDCIWYGHIIISLSSPLMMPTCMLFPIIYGTNGLMCLQLCYVLPVAKPLQSC